MWHSKYSPLSFSIMSCPVERELHSETHFDGNLHFENMFSFYNKTFRKDILVILI